MTYNFSQPDKKLAETLNAYLDGQLTPAEAENLEKRLVADPEARRLLDELRQVTQSLRQLPRTRAPDDLADEVMLQLEKDAVLSVGEELTELADRKRLRLPRFAAAAALIMLAGTVVAIVYGALYQPSWFQPAPKGPQPPETVVVLDKPAPDSVVPGPSLESPVPSVALTETPLYGSVRLVVNTYYHDADQDLLEELFIANGIEQVIRTPLDDNRSQYAFLCSIDLLRHLFQTFSADPSRRLDLADELIPDRTVVADATESQIMALAAESDPIARAELIHSYYITGGPPDDMFPDWLDWQTLARGDDPFGELYILGPNELAPSVYSQPTQDSFRANQPASAPRIAPSVSLVAVVLTLRSQPLPSNESPQPFSDDPNTPNP